MMHRTNKGEQVFTALLLVFSLCKHFDWLNIHLTNNTL